jgi:AcrR family transcriptional regulator
VNQPSCTAIPRSEGQKRPSRGASRTANPDRAEITAAAIGIADRDGLDAVSMRRVAAELGTGAASLYRYVDTQEELLDLMSNATGAEYSLPGPDSDWLAGLLTIAEPQPADHADRFPDILIRVLTALLAPPAQ